MMKECLDKIVVNPALEARWLNTLSLLEYIGSRKISKTFAKVHPPIEILEHLADESRHAYAFKRLSTIVADGKDLGYLCGDAAVTYFQTLDKKISDWISKLTRLTDSFQNYLIVTAVVERRAMKIYPYYRKISRNGFVRDELRLVMEDESSHRRIIEDQCLKILNPNDVPDFQECDAVEEEIFKVFEAAI